MGVALDEGFDGDYLEIQLAISHERRGAELLARDELRAHTK